MIINNYQNGFRKDYEEIIDEDVVIQFNEKETLLNSSYYIKGKKDFLTGQTLQAKITKIDKSLENKIKDFFNKDLKVLNFK